MTGLQRIFSTSATLMLAVAIAGTLAGCNVKEKKEGDSKNVDIRTPFGNMKVQNQADARDTGLPVYPNSREKKEDNNDSKSANVNMSFGNFGLKVVAATYEVDDKPDKVISYYHKELEKYGKVLDCKGGSIGNVNVGKDSDHDNDKELHCDSHGDSDVTEMKVGIPKAQRVVAVKSSGKGSEYSLVYVRIQGGDKEPI